MLMQGFVGLGTAFPQKSILLRVFIGDRSPLQCAGINRHEAENAKFLRVRSSDPLGPEFCVGYREVHDEA